MLRNHDIHGGEFLGHGGIRNPARWGWVSLVCPIGGVGDGFFMKEAVYIIGFYIANQKCVFYLKITF